MNTKEFGQSSSWIGPDWDEANARLIAAAPELLEALRNTTDALRRIRTHVAVYVAASSGAGIEIGAIAETFIESNEAAIQKAEGQR